MPGPFTLEQEAQNRARLKDLQISQEEELEARTAAMDARTYHPEPLTDQEKISILKDAIRELEEDMTGPTAEVEFGTGPRSADLPEKDFGGPGPCTTINLDLEQDAGYQWPSTVTKAPEGLKVTYDVFGKETGQIARELMWLDDHGVSVEIIWSPGQSPSTPTPAPFNPHPHVYPWKIGDSTPRVVPPQYPLVTYNVPDTTIIPDVPKGAPREGQFIGKKDGEITWVPDENYEDNGVVHAVKNRVAEVNLGAL